MNIITFEDALKDSAKYSKRHLLLGNGFSIACRADIFHYNSLFNQADFSEMPEIEAVFTALRTEDFETAIRSLENAALLLPAYLSNTSSVSSMMQSHANAIKALLVKTIAGNHPSAPYEISDEKFWACRRFLFNFLINNGQVFTLNYDLLLYWTLMHDDMPFSNPIELKSNDGFGNDEADPSADYVVWQGETGAHDAKVHFLHGALHLFDTGSELKKYTWIRKGVPLVEQAQQAINQNAYPLFVAEGTSKQKKSKIRHNAYLYQGFKQLTANLKQGKNCFFIYGHSLAANDDHILNRLALGRFPKLYVSLYGNPASEVNTEIVRRAKLLSEKRNELWPLEVVFYDAASAKVWGD